MLSPDTLAAAFLRALPFWYAPPSYAPAIQVPSPGYARCRFPQGARLSPLQRLIRDSSTLDQRFVRSPQKKGPRALGLGPRARAPGLGPMEKKWDPRLFKGVLDGV